MCVEWSARSIPFSYSLVIRQRQFPTHVYRQLLVDNTMDNAMDSTMFCSFIILPFTHRRWV